MTSAPLHAPATPDPVGEATRLQNLAARPDVPVWVGASAGSGKTSVLVNRYLRLLLPGESTPGTPPSAILCITYTKAGASEMTERVFSTLRRWSVAGREALAPELERLLETTPNAEQLEKAANLFARAIEAPGGLRIMTIHAFCQSVLARFPMEAELPAGFEIMTDAESRDMRRVVRHAIILRLRENLPADRALKSAFDRLGTLRNADQIESLMDSMMAERTRFADARTTNGGIDGLCAAVEHTLGVMPGSDAESLLPAFRDAVPFDALRAFYPLMAQCKTKFCQKAPTTIDAFARGAEPAAHFHEYKKLFLDSKGEAKPPSGLLKNDASALELWTAEAKRLGALDLAMRAAATAASTNALLRFSAAALDEYEQEKRRRNRLDFTDLIACTRKLLSGTGVDWVQFKLDGGIDHILLDEAQDTSPDQWSIVKSLYAEFYSGLGQREDRTRTTFVVGDEKQSIFSFQGADPRVFAREHAALDAATAPLPHRQQTIPMRVSFRSGPGILSFVDRVFAPEAMRAGVTQDGGPVTHQAAHGGKGGRIELWPVYAIDEPPNKAGEKRKSPFTHVITHPKPVEALAARVADTIAAMLADPGEILESRGDRIRPEDILILVGKRKPMAEALLRHLRLRNIPVSGIDRMVLTRQIAVQDCLAAVAFALQPDDDLNLAALLKSPFIGVDEDTLFALAHGRERRPLWQPVKARGDAVASWLSGLLATNGDAGAFLHGLLLSPCPADSRSGLRALLARLGEDARDPLEELLARADAHDMRDVRGLQGFLQDALTDDTEIKRDLQEADDTVRLMTVHGSKGLQAPIVFLPDTIRTTAARNLRDSVFWPERDDVRGIPLWPPSTDEGAQLAHDRANAIRAANDEESRRLLYVALTRAADRLYIGGAQKSALRYIDVENSWYTACETAIKPVGNIDGDVFVLQNPQTDPLAPATERARGHTRAADLPSWMRAPAPPPESPPRPLIPSRPEIDDPAVMSPLFGDISHRFRRGRLIHTLFQFLPDLPPEDRMLRAAQWLAQPAHRLNVAAQNEILEAVFGVLDTPAFAPLFTPAARAEVPLTGHLARPDGTHTVVSGQIDRLLVDESGITVLDFKTNRPAPRKIADVPAAYLRQMR
ncbi:MAG: double-strand break repair helicase AddA, partial [Alphaproteobacteria bacterium]|nr:double-strand break repair helicase AddA [Alphaproteobacteria bacterium]